MTCTVFAGCFNRAHYGQPTSNRLHLPRVPFIHKPSHFSLSVHLRVNHARLPLDGACLCCVAPAQPRRGKTISPLRKDNSTPLLSESPSMGSLEEAAAGGLLGRRRGASVVWDGGVVQEDAHLAVSATAVAEGVLDGADITGGGAGEVVRAHGNAHAILDLNLVVGVHAVGPALAAVDGKATILGVATAHNLATNKVRHGLGGGWAELEVSSLGWLEHDVLVTIGVQLASSLARRSDVVATILVGLGDALDGGSPVALHLQHLGLSHGSRASINVWHGGVVQEDASLAIVVALV